MSAARGAPLRRAAQKRSTRARRLAGRPREGAAQFRAGSEFEARQDDGFAELALELEAELFGDLLHGAVFGQDVGDDGLHALAFADVDEAAQQLGAEALLLLVVADDDGEFGSRLLPAPRTASLPHSSWQTSGGPYIPISRNNADSEKRFHSDPQAGLHLNFLERCISRVILRSV